MKFSFLWFLVTTSQEVISVSRPSWFWANRKYLGVAHSKVGRLACNSPHAHSSHHNLIGQISIQPIPNITISSVESRKVDTVTGQKSVPIYQKLFVGLWDLGKPSFKKKRNFMKKFHKTVTPLSRTAFMKSLFRILTVFLVHM